MTQGKLTFRRAQPGSEKSEGGTRVLSVGEVVRGANRLLELRFGLLCIEGEVSGVRVGGSGHAYFTLKDDQSTLSVAMWRSSLERLPFALADGQALRVFGRLGIFIKNGRFQLYAERAEPAGLGARMLELEQRRQALRAEGLFAEERKRPLPPFPRRIGVVTSAHGAAIHDIIKVAHRRWPSRILLAPAVVQGPDAPQSLLGGLRRLARFEDVDVVIIGRGGGSAEDLWAFNDEALARAIVAYRVPVVSAVGHEVDVSISDLVADVRAATPSHAAELVVPDAAAVRLSIEERHRRLQRVIERLVVDQRGRLEHGLARLAAGGRRRAAHGRSELRALEQRLARVHPRARIRRDRARLDSLLTRLEGVGRGLGQSDRAALDALAGRLRRRGAALPAQARARCNALEASLARHGRGTVAAARARWARAGGALSALSPLRVLERGYAVVTEAGRAVTDAATIKPGDDLDIRLARGVVSVTATSTTPDSSDSN